MITNRHRGLVRIHGAAIILAVALFFWVYAELTIRYLSGWMRLTRDVNLLPYFLCVLAGLLVGSSRIRDVESRLTRLSPVDAGKLATVQVGCMALAIFSMMFATQDTSISRLFLGTFLVWSWLGLSWLHRALPRRLAGLLFGQGERIPTLFVGRVENLSSLHDWLDQRAHLGVLPVGFVALDPSAGEEQSAKSQEPGGRASALAPYPLPLGGLADLPRLLAERSIAQVILLELPGKPAMARQILERCQAHGCRLLVQHQVDEILGHPVVSVDEGGRHFFALQEEPLEEPLNRALKRIFDVGVALPVVLFALPPLMLLVAIMQRLQAPGPLFHARPRSGERRVQFSMLKFRSMRVAPIDEKAEGLQARADDARVYPFGRFLRRHSLDEFPQFWNVLMGSMSIVGPRPVMPLLDEEFERQVRAYRSKHWAKPGITGLAQSEGFRGEITTPAQLQERVRLDLYYIAHWSIWLDLQITLKTAGQIFRPPSSAY